MERVDKVEIFFETLSSLEDAYYEYFLLISCFSMPKMTYLMRTTSPLPSNLSVWKSFNREIREALSCLLGSSLEQKTWEQAKLPISMSGSGLCSAAEHSSSAFLRSILDAENRIETILKQDKVTIDTEKH